MKLMKKILIVITIVAALAIPVTAFAANSNSPAAANIRSFCGIGINASNLTEQQRADLTASINKMFDLKKETINKMIQDGTITKEQGELALNRLEDMIKYHNVNGYGPGMMRSGMMRGYGYGSGMMNNYGGSGTANY
jgi:hypothetical protein